MPSYCLFPTISAAWDAIQRIDQALNYEGTGQTWGVPIEHPYSQGALIRYRPEFLNDQALAVFKDVQEIDLAEAARRDFYIGPFPGRFGKARAKLEEAQFLYDALAANRQIPAAPLVRALFFAFLSTLYALRESLKKTSMFKDNSVRTWWLARQAELEKRGELLQYLLLVVNRDKHNASCYINYNAHIYNSHIHPDEVPAGTAQIRLSAEGMLAYVLPNTPKFRRIPVGAMKARYFVTLVDAPAIHLGEPVNGSDLFNASQIALEYFEQTVFDAEQLEATDVKNGFDTQSIENKA